jgi:hypothetical protein
MDSDSIRLKFNCSKIYLPKLSIYSLDMSIYPQEEMFRKKGSEKVKKGFMLKLTF